MKLLWAAAFASLLAAPASAQEGKDVGRGTGAQGARWRTAEVELTVDASVERLSARAFETLVGAVSEWQAAGEHLPTITVERGATGELGYLPGKPNKNIIRYEPEGSKRAQGALAITVLTFDLERGVILDADILINGDYDFDSFENDTDVRQASAYDLQNVLTHEVGHLLGLGEDYEHEDATMYAYSLPGETAKRELAPPDADRVNVLYSELILDEELGPAETCGVGMVAGAQAQIAGRGAWMLTGLFLLMAGYRLRRKRGSALCLAAFVLLCPQAFSQLELAASPPAATLATVSALTSRWEGGLIVTEARVLTQSGSTLKLTTLGGQVGTLAQQVSHIRPLKVGALIELRASRGRD